MIEKNLVVLLNQKLIRLVLQLKPHLKNPLLKLMRVMGRKKEEMVMLEERVMMVIVEERVMMM